MSRCVGRSSVVLLVLLLVPAAAYAQAAITGIARDTSGGVLPGVTVEAASPALIEKVRSVVTDGTGQYRIVNLLPGTYSVTFTLPGFGSVKRDGVVLSGDFAATVNGDLSVGDLAETITVTGEAPIVDVQGVKVQQVLDKEILSAIPSARTVQGISALIPGLTAMSQTGRRDVGGAGGVHGGDTQGMHGLRAVDSRTLNEGMSTNFAGGNAGTGNNANVGGAQEVVVTISGGLGEQEGNGVTINIIPRDGGNTFNATAFLSGANSGMASSNYTQELKDRGLAVPERLVKVYDFNPMGGGPIFRDKLWFFYTDRVWGSTLTVPGMYYNKNAGDPTKWTFEPDLSRQATGTNVNKNHILRLTWQATPRNKIAVSWNEQYTCLRCDDGGTATQTIEATGHSEFRPSRVQTATWSSPITSRLLAEAGFGTYFAHYGSGWTNGRTDGTDNPALIRVVDQNAVIPGLGTIPGLAYRYVSNFNRSQVWDESWRASVSYVTGAHNAKFGYFGAWHQAPTRPYSKGIISAYRFNNGVPNQVTVTGLGDKYLNINNHVFPTGLYAQDQWTRGKLTVQGGLRYDYVRTTYSEQRIEGPLIPTLVFPPSIGLTWHDITPRMGLAYDLFGNGKTALKFNAGKYMESVVSRVSDDYTNLNPLQRLATTTTRAWNDANRDYAVQCDLANPNANGECGDMANKNLGTATFDRTADPEWTSGWGKRAYNWGLGAQIQHEVLPRVSVSVGYYRNMFFNQYVLDNLAVDKSSYTEYSFQAPVDPRLPGGGGYTVTGLYDLLPSAVGLRREYVTSGKNYPKQIEYWHGVDTSINARLENGLTLRGGTSTGRKVADNCALREVLPEIGTTATAREGGGTFVPTTINFLEPVNPYCRFVEPWLTRVTALAAYMIPRVDVQVSATWQNNPGPMLEARYPVPNAVIRPYLGRDLSAQAANVTLQLVPNGTLYGERIDQVDFRVAKILRYRGTRWQISADLYNALNASPIEQYNQNYSPTGSWLRPNSVLTARFARLGMQFDF